MTCPLWRAHMVKNVNTLQFRYKIFIQILSQLSQNQTAMYFLTSTVSLTRRDMKKDKMKFSIQLLNLHPASPFTDTSHCSLSPPPSRGEIPF